jgi:hypothetical protein
MRKKHHERCVFLASLESKFKATREMLAKKSLELQMEHTRMQDLKKAEDKDLLASKKHHLLSTKAVKGVYAFKTGGDGLNDHLLQNSSGIKAWKKQIGKSQQRFRKIKLAPIEKSKLTDYERQKPFIGPFLPRYELEKFKNIQIRTLSGYNLRELLDNNPDKDSHILQSNLRILNLAVQVFKVHKHITYEHVARLDIEPYRDPVQFIKLHEARIQPPV